MGKTELTDKEMINKLEIPFTPIDNKVLIKPLDPVKIEKEFTELDESKNKNKKQGQDGDTMDTKKTKKTVDANVRKGVVLALPQLDKNEKVRFPIEVGDAIVYYDKSSMQTFDLYRDSILMNKYEILGKWDINKERDSDIYGKVTDKDSDGKTKKDK